MILRGICALGLMVAAWVERARASDVGTAVMFQNAPLPYRFWPLWRVGAGDVVWEMGPSAPISEPFDAVLWQGVCPDEGIVFEVSRKEGLGPWSDWMPAQMHRFPRGRFWARVVFTRESAGSIRLRALSKNPPAHRPIEVFSWDAFLRRDSETADAPRRSIQPGTSAPGADANRPKIYGRQDWEANPPKAPPVTHVPERITQHHTAGRYSETLEDSLQEVRFIQDFHQNGRGWNDIGYHFLLDGAGNLFQGRLETHVGAHVRSHNTGNIGMAVLGGYHPPRNHSLTSAQREALKAVGGWLVKRYGISIVAYKGHRDYNPSTECPGDRVYSELRSIRDSFGEPVTLNGYRPEGGEPSALPGLLVGSCSSMTGI